MITHVDGEASSAAAEERRDGNRLACEKATAAAGPWAGGADCAARRLCHDGRRTDEGEGDGDGGSDVHGEAHGCLELSHRWMWVSG